MSRLFRRAISIELAESNYYIGQDLSHVFQLLQPTDQGRQCLQPAEKVTIKRAVMNRKLMLTSRHFGQYRNKKLSSAPAASELPLIHPAMCHESADSNSTVKRAYSIQYTVRFTIILAGKSQILNTQ